MKVAIALAAVLFMGSLSQGQCFHGKCRPPAQHYRAPETFSFSTYGYLPAVPVRPMVLVPADEYQPQPRPEAQSQPAQPQQAYGVPYRKTVTFVPTTFRYGLFGLRAVPGYRRVDSTHIGAF